MSGVSPFLCFLFNFLERLLLKQEFFLRDKSQKCYKVFPDFG
ncbi:hypothetical protein AB434_2522 [Heyndrickxia coagulans]|uniref:Uncharacterized protein n=1 Tax=Heyndrickxia coagulans TaxID=1398 RepID=A0A0C5C9P7_HEYCO|nr:hypothetical protein SB48_HM08orf04432 [Heyndrickxia coagulans]AKN54927.1 hypothetical protein AB434_2522 [Heyndrickxia coagulans]KWZ77227.1 hypothetical protein HMPREF3213_03416 [Heyndrickxia coagulans]KYC63531.1 hypothetical protein B4100_0182 [Heyndrickxia coagulans]KYC65279.1 hypothetical protein B4098_0232 [Heyndrickxia coagulans]